MLMLIWGNTEGVQYIREYIRQYWENKLGDTEAILHFETLSHQVTFFLPVSKGNVWEKVSSLPDKIHPDYTAVERLFSQKVIAETVTDSPAHKKHSDIVRA